MLVTNNSLIRSNGSVYAYSVHTCCVLCSLDYLNSQLVSKSRLHLPKCSDSHYIPNSYKYCIDTCLVLSSLSLSIVH